MTSSNREKPKWIDTAHWIRWEGSNGLSGPITKVLAIVIAPYILALIISLILILV